MTRLSSDTMYWTVATTGGGTEEPLFDLWLTVKTMAKCTPNQFNKCLQLAIEYGYLKTDYKDRPWRYRKFSITDKGIAWLVCRNKEKWAATDKKYIYEEGKKNYSLSKDQLQEIMNDIPNDMAEL